MSLTELGGNKLMIPAQGEFANDIPAWDGNIEKLFLRCIVEYISVPKNRNRLREKEDNNPFLLS